MTADLTLPTFMPFIDINVGPAALVLVRRGVNFGASGSSCFDIVKIMLRRVSTGWRDGALYIYYLEN